MLRIKKRLFVVVILLLLSACQSASLRSAGSGVNAHPALWEAKSQQGTVYLFGSVHALSPRVKWYGEKIKRVFGLADELVLETVYSDNTEKIFKRVDRKYGSLKKGKVISDYLTKAEYAKYRAIVKVVGLEQRKADRMKPWLFFAIINATANQKASQYGVDKLFYNAATAKKLKISALETIYQQMSSVAAQPFSQQIRDLKEALNAKKIDTKNISRQKVLMTAWKTGNTSLAARLLADTTSTAVYNTLIIKRNNLWYPKIKRYLSKKQSTMIVVGLAHLVGRGNIISKLKNSGYKVRRLQ